LESIPWSTFGDIEGNRETEGNRGKQRGERGEEEMEMTDVREARGAIKKIEN
jgi:hypothetical protein